MNGIQKVVGSIPIVSTKLSLDAIRVPGSFFIELSGSRFNQSNDHPLLYAIIRIKKLPAGGFPLKRKHLLFYAIIRIKDKEAAADSEWNNLAALPMDIIISYSLHPVNPCRKTGVLW